MASCGVQHSALSRMSLYSYERLIVTTATTLRDDIGRRLASIVDAARRSHIGLHAKKEENGILYGCETCYSITIMYLKITKFLLSLRDKEKNKLIKISHALIFLSYFLHV